MTALQLSDVQVLLSLQTLAVPPQMPVLHASPLVQALPSLQTVPSLTAVLTQLPVGASQLSVVQALLSLHVFAVPPQTPKVQASAVVQARPSLHEVPSAKLLNTHAPVLGLQASLVQVLLSVQTLAVPVQVPAWQLSPLVQALLSLQTPPLATAV